MENNLNEQQIDDIYQVVLKEMPELIKYDKIDVVNTIIEEMPEIVDIVSKPKQKTEKFIPEKEEVIRPMTTYEKVRSYIPEPIRQVGETLGEIRSDIKSGLAKPEALATIAGVASIPLTAGMSIPTAVATQAGIAGGAEAIRQVAAGENKPSEIFKEGAISGSLAASIPVISTAYRSIPFKRGVAWALSKLSAGGVKKQVIQKAIDEKTGEIIPKYKKMVEDAIKKTGKIAENEIKYIQIDGAKEIESLAKKMKTFRNTIGKKIEELENNAIKTTGNKYIDISDLKKELQEQLMGIEQAGLSEVPEYKQLVGFINKQLTMPDSITLSDAIKFDRIVRKNLLSFSKNIMEVQQETPIEVTLRKFNMGLKDKIKSILSENLGDDFKVYSVMRDYIDDYNNISKFLKTSTDMEKINSFKKISDIVSKNDADLYIIEKIPEKIPNKYSEAKKSIGESINKLIQLSAAHNVYKYLPYAPSSEFVFGLRGLSTYATKKFTEGISKPPTYSKFSPLLYPTYLQYINTGNEENEKKVE